MLVLFMCLFAFCNSQGPGELKYVINFDSPIYAFGEDSLAFADTSGVFVERQNESHAYMHGELKLLKGLGDKSILEIIILKETSGKFEVFFTHDICDLCKELKDETSDYKKQLQHIGFPAGCPIEAGTYKIHDLFLDFDDMQITGSQVGRYEAQLNLCIQTGESCQERECLCMLKMDVMIEEIYAR